MSTTAQIGLVLAGAAGPTVVAIIGVAAARSTERLRTHTERAARWEERRVAAYAEVLSLLNRALEVAFRGSTHPQDAGTLRDELVGAVARARLLSDHAVGQRLDELLKVEANASNLQGRSTSAPDSAWRDLNLHYSKARDAFLVAAQHLLSMPDQSAITSDPSARGDPSSPT